MKPFSSKPLSSIDAYMYGLKSRAHLHHCHGNGMFPVELTQLNVMRKRYSRQIRPVTLTPFFIKAVALSIRANPAANRILFQRFPLRRRIVQFENVDVNVPITRIINGERVTFIGTIRGADKLTIAQIQDELIHLQRDAPEQSPYVRKMEMLRRAPPIAVSLYHWLMSRSPRFYLKNAGTCGVTTLDGMPGGFFFPIGPTTATFGIGGIGDEVVARDGAPVVRRVLRVALALDNYVAGGPEGLELALTFQRLLGSCTFVESEFAEQSASSGPAAAAGGQVAGQSE
jgi:pyruvate/2-oxoglutarate dehydrogenase complex dihydrolipoamide acyltransferase (E2) component